MKRLALKTTGFTGTSIFFRPDGTYDILESETLPNGFVFGADLESGFVVSSFGTFVIKVTEGEVVVTRPILWALDWFTTPMTINSFEGEEGSVFLDPISSANKTIGSAGLLIWDFVDMEDGSVLSFDFAESSQSGVLRDIVVRVTEPGGISTTYDTGEDWRPRDAFGGYRRGDNTFIYIEHKEGNDPVLKRIIKLDNSFTAVDFFSNADSSNLSTLVKTSSGGVFTSGQARVLSQLDETTMQVTVTADMEAYVTGQGYDTGGFCGKIMSDKDDFVYAIYQSYDTVQGDVRHLLLEYQASTNTITRHVEIDAPTFGNEIGGISMAFHENKIILIGNKDDGFFATRIVDLSTFTLDPSPSDSSHDINSGFYPVGTGYSNGGNKVFFGLDGGSSGVPFSLCMVYDVDTQVISFAEFTPYASDNTQFSPVLVTFVEV